MKRFFILFFTIALFFCSCAALPDVTAMRRQYPDANAVLLNDEEYIRYNPDGSSVSTDTFSYLVLTEKGREQQEVFRSVFLETEELMRSGSSPFSSSKVFS